MAIKTTTTYTCDKCEGVMLASGFTVVAPLPLENGNIFHREFDVCKDCMGEIANLLDGAFANKGRAFNGSSRRLGTKPRSPRRLGLPSTFEVIK